ncbi:MAG: SGNH/GDSL hydrolase family protein [Lachnospiraceae bacterium]|jgi:lysophospholipase L1-like esterase|nr:SGNH/GDSL hydrolase family protein [Lachnospiraceae bacterium]
MNLSGKTINILGDSITEGTGASDENHIYWKYFETIDGATVNAYGIGGTRIAKQRVPSEEAKYDEYFGKRVAGMANDADIVLVFGGTNDHGHGDAPLGHMSDRTDDTFYGALHNLYTALIEKYPASRIIVMTPLHRLGENDDINGFGIRNVGTLKDYVNIIKEVAAYYALPVIDLYETSGMQPELPILQSTYNPDGLHPSDAGHKRIYDVVKAFLASM